MTRMTREPKDAPKLIAIDHDDYHASHVGHTADGHQFFLTTPFVSAGKDNPGCEFIALYIFDDEGALLEAHIDNLGPRAELDNVLASSLFDQRLSQLGPVEYGRIEVKPFEVERFGTTFGLIPQPPEDEDDYWSVTVEPGDYMAFYEPWDSGDYDT